MTKDKKEQVDSEELDIEIVEEATNQSDEKAVVQSDDDLEYISASFTFQEPCVMEANETPFEFNPGDSLQLFVSYRYSVNSLAKTLKPYGIKIEKSFQSKNGEEGVFICSL